MTVKDVYYGKTLRKSFARYQEILEMPNLLEIQKKSYQWFLDVGLREVFRDVAAITDYAGNLELSFIDYSMDEKPKYDVEECKARDCTYAAPIKVRVRLRNKETEEIKEQEIFMGDFPLMTKAGTFVINGAERVIVSQIVRSPGIYYSHTEDKAGGITYATTVNGIGPLRIECRNVKMLRPFTHLFVRRKGHADITVRNIFLDKHSQCGHDFGHACFIIRAQPKRRQR